MNSIITPSLRLTIHQTHKTFVQSQNLMTIINLQIKPVIIKQNIFRYLIMYSTRCTLSYPEQFLYVSAIRVPTSGPKNVSSPVFAWRALSASFMQKSHTSFIIEQWAVSCLSDLKRVQNSDIFRVVRHNWNHVIDFEPIVLRGSRWKDVDHISRKNLFISYFY